ncbi:MAG: exodeoxyribonuclease VII small subunit [Saprospiraceae bacterium]|nr:exodeoxyribonuclease VII small subunit [Saprospiraceae bacterium]
MDNQELTYETAYAELHHILQSIQQDEIGLDQLASQLRRARELVDFCREKLRTVENELNEIFEEDE